MWDSPDFLSHPPGTIRLHGTCEMGPAGEMSGAIAPDACFIYDTPERVAALMPYSEFIARMAGLKRIVLVEVES